VEFYLTSKRTGAKIHLPMNPERVTARTGASMRTFEVIELGEIKFPKGKIPAAISWEGVFPGAARRNIPFVKNWRDPTELVNVLQEFRDTGERVQLLITGTPLNLEVYIETFEHTWGGGFGDCAYTLSLVQARELKVYTESEWKRLSKEQTFTATMPARTRSVPSPPKTYTVKSGDSLFLIAKKTLGSGTAWRKIYDVPANRKIIGPNPNLIQPGQVLQIPGGEGK